ncbi:MAG: hypothetical protein AAFR44_13630, partial [Pseudomonadota bacterium]
GQGAVVGRISVQGGFRDYGDLGGRFPGVLLQLLAEPLLLAERRRFPILRPSREDSTRRGHAE